MYMPHNAGTVLCQRWLSVEVLEKHLRAYRLSGPVQVDEKLLLHLTRLACHTERVKLTRQRYESFPTRPLGHSARGGMM